MPQAIVPTVMTDEYGEYLLYEIREKAANLQILDPGSPVHPVFGYAVAGAGPTVPGPLIKVDQNTRVRCASTTTCRRSTRRSGTTGRHVSAPARVRLAARSTTGTPTT